MNVIGPGSTPPADQPRAAPGNAVAARRFFWRAVAISVLLVVGSAVVSVVPPARAALLATRVSMIFCLLLGGVTCAVTGLRHRGAERAWRLLVAAMVLGIWVGAVQMFPAVVGRGPPVPRLTAASLAYLIPQAFGLAGVLCYPTDPFDLSLREPGRGRDRHWYVITILDGLIVAGAVTLLAWIVVLEDAVAGMGPLGSGPIYSVVLTATSLIVMVAAILVAVFRQPRSGGGLSLLIMGLLAVTASIASYMAVVVRGRPDIPRPLDLLLIVGPLLLGLAALAPATRRPAPAGDGLEAAGWFVPPRRRRWHAVLPYLPLTAAGVVTLVELTGESLGQQEELWALLGLLLLALVRQMTTMSDNIRLLGQVEDKQHQLRYQAFHDPLTGLANRALFTDRLERALRRRDRGAGRLAVLFCDLDGFKQVNDEFGHAAGDDLLRVTARRLARSVRPTDTVARLGGDEFAILLDPSPPDPRPLDPILVEPGPLEPGPLEPGRLEPGRLEPGRPGSGGEDPEAVGRRLAAAVRAPIRLGDTTCTVAASTGLVVVDPDGGPVTADALLHRADLAMYAAKAQGTGQPTAYTPDLAAPRSGTALRAALAAVARGETSDGQLAVTCRPILDLGTATQVAHEARLAWAHPEHGATQPTAAGRPDGCSWRRRRMSHNSDPVLDAPFGSEPEPDELIQAAMRWHFSPDTGSPFWLGVADTLDFDPVRDVRTFADLARFPNVVNRLRDVRVRDLIPRGYGPDPGLVGVYESGGTTGAPKRVVILEDWMRRLVAYAEDQNDRRDVPRSVGWLSLAPTGPHLFGELVGRQARRRGCLCFTVDLDPRWVRRVLRAGRPEEAERYAEHVIEQAGVILATQDIGVLVTTPPLLERLARRDDLVKLVNEHVRVIFWGGAHLDADTRSILRDEVFPGIQLSGVYGSTMVLGAASERLGLTDDDPCVFDPFSPYLSFEVVDPRTRRQVGYGERGQVVMHHVSRTALLPNNLERDLATRVEPPPGQVGDSAADVGPVAVFDDEPLIEGVY